MFKSLKESDFIFTEEDYQTFAKEYWESIHPAIMNRRHKVQEKLHEINIHLIPKLHSLGINVELHPAILKNPRLEFSWDRPVPYNKGKVNWMGTRYGRKTDITELGYQKDKFSYRELKDIDKIGFQKFTVFQIDITEYGVEVGLFHAVPNDSIDRDILHRKILDDNWYKNFVELLKNIKGHGFEWYISSSGSDDSEDIDRWFRFDFENPEDFRAFYKNYDKEGKYSSLLYRFPKWDKRIMTKNIIQSCLDIFELLYPLYQIIKN